MLTKTNDVTRNRGALTTRYAGVVATLALFVALGGSAAAVTQLPRDSVGSPQIRNDAVRSPEIARDAVRSPEIAAGAVRSSELRDGAIRLADISAHAQHALAGAQGPAGVVQARVAENSTAGVNCGDQRLTTCSNLLARTLRKGNWIVEAKLDVANAGPAAPADTCGLVQGSTVLDTAGVKLDAGTATPDIETLALTGAVKGATNATTVGLRCAAGNGERVIAEHMRITALQVTTITGP
jgi:hypothetical protein